MLARLSFLLPAVITGRVEPRARHIVRSWTAANGTRRTLRYGVPRRFLMWGTDHPILFSGAMAACSAFVSYTLATVQLPWRLQSPASVATLDLAAFSGTPWTVQATLVALVYPIVLSFIALLLQRKAHSTVALRMYILDSGVVAAGASSIALLLVMGIQYLVSPYATADFRQHFMGTLIVANGVWLTINVLLTSFFLGRTMHFIQEEEQRHAYARIAVDLVLRGELISSVKQHLYVDAANIEGRASDASSVRRQAPEVRLHSTGHGLPQVSRDLKGNLVLLDVHTHLLIAVARMWRRRAERGTWQNERKLSTLSFPPEIGRQAGGNITLCRVENGPPLTFVERMLVRLAFVFGRPARDAMSLSTQHMLTEIGREIESAAEQHQFGAAEDGLNELIKLHKILLLASVAAPGKSVDNAAAISASPYSFGGNSFDIAWLRPYMEIGRIAIDCLDQDTRLFRTLNAIPTRIAGSIPPYPHTLVTNLQLVTVRLSEQLGAWWVRKAEATTTSHDSTFSGALPAPLDKVYEHALMSMIGAWGYARVDIPEISNSNQEEIWRALSARALFYAEHIENSARMFMRAVERGDVVGSRWLFDNFLKWWGNKQFELKCDNIERDYRARNVTIKLADKSWDAAQSFLWDGDTAVTIDFARQALSLGVRRYWESTRLYLVLMLIRAAASHNANSLELNYAASLICAKQQFPGGSVEHCPMDSVDAVLGAALGILFGDESPMIRLDHFADSLDRNQTGPLVSGWTYSWVGMPTSIDALQGALSIVLTSLAMSASPAIRYSKTLVERWAWQIDKLEDVERYCQRMQRSVLSGEFNASARVASRLMLLLTGRPRGRSSGRLAVAGVMQLLGNTARKERRLSLRVQTVDSEKIRQFARLVANATFDATSIPIPIRQLYFSPSLSIESSTLPYNTSKLRYLPAGTGDSQDEASGVAEALRAQLLATAFELLVSVQSLEPINTLQLSDDEAQPAIKQQFLRDVVAQCEHWRAQGQQPVILAGQSYAGAILDSHYWGNMGWQCPLPNGIVVAPGSGVIQALINEAPVYQFDTLNRDCYVLPEAYLATLRVEGSSAADALSTTWRIEGDDRLQMTFAWRAEFQQRMHQTS